MPAWLAAGLPACIGIGPGIPLTGRLPFVTGVGMTSGAPAPSSSVQPMPAAPGAGMAPAAPFPPLGALVGRGISVGCRPSFGAPLLSLPDLSLFIAMVASCW